METRSSLKRRRMDTTLQNLEIKRTLVVGNESLLALIMTFVDVWEHACKLQLVCQRWRAISQTPHSFSRHLTLHRHIVNHLHATKWICMRNFAALALSTRTLSLSVGSTMQGLYVLESLDLPNRAPNLEVLDLRGTWGHPLEIDTKVSRRLLRHMTKLRRLGRLVMPHMMDARLYDTIKRASILCRSLAHVHELDMDVSCRGVPGLTNVLEFFAAKLTGLRLYVSEHVAGVDKAVANLLSHATKLRHLSVRGDRPSLDEKMARDQGFDGWTSDVIHVIFRQAVFLSSLETFNYWPARIPTCCLGLFEQLVSHTRAEGTPAVLVAWRSVWHNHSSDSRHKCVAWLKEQHGRVATTIDCHGSVNVRG